MTSSKAIVDACAAIRMPLSGGTYPKKISGSARGWNKPMSGASNKCRARRIGRPSLTPFATKAAAAPSDRQRESKTMPQSRPPATSVLPAPDTKRWSPGRKAAVVAATRTGLISREEACARYLLSDEELAEWEKAYDRNGVPGLRTTRQQSYRAAQLHPSEDVRYR
ncbi:MAG: DUF1153 domain-containing protein [Stellaceae bacterium]